MKTKNIILCLLIFSAAGISAQTITPKGSDPKPAEAKWYDKVNFSGYVDVYYNYTANNRQGSTQDTTGTFHTYNKQFAVNAVKLSVEKLPEKETPWGFRLDIQNGQNIMYQERPYQTSNSIYNMQLLQQAYVSFYFPVAKGLVIDAGKMATHIGNEVLDSKDNLNYTIGYIFFNTIPFIHTGARATITLTDKLSAGLYLYNSAQGTGYTANGQQFGFAGTTPVGPNGATINGAPQAGLLTSPNQSISGNHVYVDGPNPMKSIGTQMKFDAVKDKFKIVWNTLYGNDVTQGRPSDADFYLSQSGMNGRVPGGPLLTQPNQVSKNNRDYWFINHMSFIINPTDKFSILLDWTFGERSGYAITNAAGYTNEGFYIDSNRDGVIDTVNGTDLKYRPSKQDVKRIYNTYGIWAKYTINDKYAIGLRYENIDDSRYGGSLAVNAPLAFTNPRDRYDLQAASGDSGFTNSRYAGLGRPASGLGQARTLTLTPIINFTENLQVKIDLRRDWALGTQFIDPSGRAVKGQNGIIIGVVAKF
ncbi:MAG TPA: outer membrane beta-barrel protein [Leptospiraceae bacterium]|nr:outer membrane beta-barrel protein [Leptospiraceae bacterium]HMW06106.1 outer membrane beta-barrel protein [Leptospiraceae bacterium]HMX30766.1 outer membrane beta-barrel protein [Leptospiraceae bacterium]HMY31767.1 outer membrane beta-barrel protein [Leptospiraceae bacterium]HMZ63098.1 outer membrane beta-barrel protein [Leptospiraceae bacterium]